jgi:hypothetical protein
MPKGETVGWLVIIDVVGKLVFIDVNKSQFSLMGVFGDFSKVVPLWLSPKHGPHRNMI